MKIITPSFSIVGKVNGKKILKNIEAAGRTCYKSEDKITEDSAKKFVANVIRSDHESVIEHEKVTVRIICDRGVTHEIVRHRLASYSQESSRYCNYSNEKFGGEITVIKPLFWKEDSLNYKIWKESCEAAEKAYFDLLTNGATPQEARSVLPNSLKTEIVMTANLREWRHFFKLRCARASHPQMVEIARPILKEFQNLIPIIFDDIQFDD